MGVGKLSKFFHWFEETFGPREKTYHKDGRWYVYEILDPRFDPPFVFYLGKGTGDRMYEHAAFTRRMLKAGKDGKVKPGNVLDLQPRHKRLIEIWDSGMDELYRVPYRTNNECDAYRAEAERIEKHGLEKILNEQYGMSEKTECLSCGRCGARLKIGEELLCCVCLEDLGEKNACENNKATRRARNARRTAYKKVS